MTAGMTGTFPTGPRDGAGLVPRVAWTRSPAPPAGALAPLSPPRSGRGRWPTGAAMLVALVCVVWLAVSSGATTPAPAAAPPPAAACGPSWVTGWQASMQPGRADLTGATLRMVVNPGATGTQVRVRLSNRFGATPLVVGTAAAGRSDGAAGTARPVAFAGLPGVTIASGADVVSDPVPLPAEAGRPLAVSLVLTAAPEVVPQHPVALQTSYLARGASAEPVDSWFVLTGVDVLTPRPVAAVVAMGDSITDGVGSPADAEERWSDALAARLSAAGGPAGMAVLNAGLSGNQLVAADPAHDLDSPLARLDTDVTRAAGASDVVLNIGTNDLAAGRSAPDVVAGLQVYARSAHAAGKRVFLTTITPSTLGPHGTRAAVAARAAVNTWVRDHGREYADGVFDFAAAVADPVDPGRLASAFDAGDGLHLSAAGYRALADAVDIGRLTGSPCLAETGPAVVAAN